MPLDNPPPARRLAQMRAFAAQHALPPSVADAMAGRGMTPARAALMATNLGELRKAAEAAGRSAADLAKMVEEFLDALPSDGDPTPDQMKLAATAVLARGASDVREAVNRRFGSRLTGAEVEMIVHRHTTQEAAMSAAADLLLSRDAEGAGPETRLGIGSENYTVGRSWDHGDGLAARMAAGLAHRVNPAVALQGPGREFAGVTLPALAMRWAAAHGHRPHSEREAVQVVMRGAPHTSSDFISTVVGGSVDLALARGYAQQLPEIARASREIERDDYRIWHQVRTGAATEIAPVAEGGEFQNATFTDEGAPGPVAAINGRIFSVTEEALANDRIDALQGITRGMVMGAVERVRNGLCGVLVGAGGVGPDMRDGNALFDAAHGNLASGAAIGVASVGSMVAAMRRQTGPGGEALDVRPRFLLVPPELETAARQFVAQISAATVSDVNPWGGVLEVLVEPGLSDAGRWYLSADPDVADGLAHSVVGGSAPRVETKLGWERPVVEFRVRLDIGFGVLDWRALQMNPGA